MPQCISQILQGIYFVGVMSVKDITPLLLALFCYLGQRVLYRLQLGIFYSYQTLGIQLHQNTAVAVSKGVDRDIGV